MTILLIEVVLRLFFSMYVTPIYMLDEDCQFRPKPGTSHYWQQIPPNWRDNVEIRVNSQGFRGPEREFAADELRVLVYGDSFVMAEFSDFEATYCVQLEQQLATALGRKVHVVNAGSAGGGPDQYLPRMKREMPLVDPDLVVVAIYAGNDFGDLTRDKMYRVADDGSVVPNAFTLSDKVRREFAVANRPAIYRMVHRLRMDRRLEFGWELMDLPDPEQQRIKAYDMVERDLELCKAEYKEYVTKRRDDVRVLLDDHYDSDLAMEPSSESSVYKVKLMEGVLPRLVQQVRSANVPVLTLAIPAPTDTVDVYRGGAVDPKKYPNYRRSRLTDEVARIAALAEAPCVDLFGPFRERQGEVFLKAPDIHWNDAGQKLAATLTRERIVTDQLFRAR